MAARLTSLESMLMSWNCARNSKNGRLLLTFQITSMVRTGKISPGARPVKSESNLLLLMLCVLCELKGFHKLHGLIGSEIRINGNNRNVSILKGPFIGFSSSVFGLPIVEKAG